MGVAKSLGCNAAALGLILGTIFALSIQVAPNNQTIGASAGHSAPARIISSWLSSLASHHSNSSASSSSSKRQESSSSSEHVTYVSNTPKAPPSFVSSTMSPVVANPGNGATTTAACNSSLKEQSSAGMIKSLRDSVVKRRAPVKTLLESSICGRVPIFERVYEQSINETFKAKTGDADDKEDGGDFRILHGIDATRGEWPWIAKLNVCMDKYNCGSCTGSLLNSRWIITAGHCLQNSSAPASWHSAQLGKYDMLVEEKSVINVTFDKAIRHPNWTDKFDNDLSLLRLSKPVLFSDYVQPICLIDKRHKDSVEFSRDRKCYNIGYGVTLSRGTALKLQKLEVEAKNSSECNDPDVFEHGLNRGHVCIGPRAEHIGASCRGDSGGPNACYDPHTNQWYLFSTVSYGPYECDRDEGDKWLTASVDVSYFTDWIEKTMADNK